MMFAGRELDETSYANLDAYRWWQAVERGDLRFDQLAPEVQAIIRRHRTAFDKNAHLFIELQETLSDLSQERSEHRRNRNRTRDLAYSM